jgi:catechol 2,3-dioxygenase-like lactoylglutathione lyase family enzyme
MSPGLQAASRPLSVEPTITRLFTPRNALHPTSLPTRGGTPGGIIHFGFRLTRPEDIDAAVAAVENAGGTVTSRGEFGPGLPYAFVRDPDGYEIEIWFE